MTTTIPHLAETKPQSDPRPEPKQNLQLTRVSARIVPMRTLYLQLKPGCSLFEGEPQPGDGERHPELYIG
jgi:hypothetical protein